MSPTTGLEAKVVEFLVVTVHFDVLGILGQSDLLLELHQCVVVLPLLELHKLLVLLSGFEL